jgi:eukaryotic-like serine/threonine-protein kinase
MYEKEFDMAYHIGQQIGNYRLVQLLGKGGFAKVYLAEHIHLGTSVAIKILHTQLTPKDLDDFLVEAQRIARLRHRHIIRILDFGIDPAENVPYLVMDYASQGTLRQLHPHGRQVPLTTVVSYVKQIAEALQFTHDQKLIHRDVKPENILMGDNNELFLSDFGITVIAHSTSSMTPQNQSGTIHYMAPEQINGKPRPASDQYSLGVVVYEWLGGVHHMVT